MAPRTTPVKSIELGTEELGCRKAWADVEDDDDVDDDRLPALASIRCSVDAYTALTVLSDIGLMAARAQDECPYEVELRKLACHFDTVEARQRSRRKKRR